MGIHNTLNTRVTQRITRLRSIKQLRRRLTDSRRYLRLQVGECILRMLGRVRHRHLIMRIIRIIRLRLLSRRGCNRRQLVRFTLILMHMHTCSIRSHRHRLVPEQRVVNSRRMLSLLCISIHLDIRRVMVSNPRMRLRIIHIPLPRNSNSNNSNSNSNSRDRHFNSSLKGHLHRTHAQLL